MAGEDLTVLNNNGNQNGISNPINAASARKQAELSYMKMHGPNILFKIYLEQKNKFENEILKLEHKYGKSNVRRFVQNARWNSRSIFLNSISRACNVGYDIRSMMKNDSVNSILKFSVVEIGKIVRNSKDEIDNVISGLDDMQNGIFA